MNTAELIIYERTLFRFVIAASATTDYQKLCSIKNNVVTSSPCHESPNIGPTICLRIETSNDIRVARPVISTEKYPTIIMENNCIASYPDFA